MAEARPLLDLPPSDLEWLGSEALDLHALARGGLPVVNALVLPLGGEAAISRLRSAIEQGFALGYPALRLRILTASSGAAERLRARLGVYPDLHPEGPWQAQVEELERSITDPDLQSVLGSFLRGLALRIAPCDRGQGGRAASTDPVQGHPEELRVWSYEGAGATWRVERRTLRALSFGGGGLDEAQVMQIADLADRAQLQLGRPVEIEWCYRRGAPAILAIQPLVLRPSFSTQAWRRVVLMDDDQGTIAPMSVEILDGALQAEIAYEGEHALVRRIYGRAYRRVEGVSSRVTAAARMATFLRAAARTARVARDLTAPLAAARDFRSHLETGLADLDLVCLDDAPNDRLIDVLRDSRSWAVEAGRLIERARRATGTLLASLENIVGRIHREELRVLAAPRAGRLRMRGQKALLALAQLIEEERGEIEGRAALSPELQARWDEVEQSLRSLPSLGIDIARAPWGEDHETLLRVLRSVHDNDPFVRERARRATARRLLGLARQRPLGRGRQATVAFVLLLLLRLAKTKGELAEGLAEALLRLRRSALECGRRLVDRGVLDAAEDALYLTTVELEDALSAQPGAYAARVRLRREDDARWANFYAPERILGRQGARAEARIS